MVLHLWFRECLDLFGVAENIKTLLINCTEKWRVILCAGNSELILGEVFVCNLSVTERKDCEISWYRVIDDKVIKSLQEVESYKYLGMLEADRFLREEIKLKVSKKYFRRLKKVKFEFWEFSSRTQYLGSVRFKMLNSIF